METPPRAWGRLTGWHVRKEKIRKHPHGRGEDATLLEGRYLYVGNTPTGVGKTRFRSYLGGGSWKHPHGRGEDRQKKWHCYLLERNTPTGVGKTRSMSE